MRLEFWVSGIPIAQGSLRAFPVPHRPGRVILTSTAKDLTAWRNAVGYAAMAAMRLAGATMTTEAVRLDLTFILPRPKSLSATRPTPRHRTRPDRDKLLRAICDAGAGIIWADDAQIDAGETTKCYAEAGEGTRCRPGVEIEVEWEDGVPGSSPEAFRKAPRRPLAGPRRR